ncbi:response regulator, partial [Microbacterium sp. HMWF026]
MPSTDTTSPTDEPAPSSPPPPEPIAADAPAEVGADSSPAATPAPLADVAGALATGTPALSAPSRRRPRRSTIVLGAALAAVLVATGAG